MAPISWIRQVSSLVPELQIIPLFGNSPPFDWSQFASKLSDHLKIPHLSIHPKDHEFRSASPYADLGSKPFIAPVSIHPIGTLFWAMSREDMIKFASWMMKPEVKPRALFTERLQTGFYRYVLLETLSILSQMPPFQQLTLQLEQQEESSPSFCIDIEVQIEGKSCWGRCVIPETFRKKWIEHFSRTPMQYAPTPLTQELLMNVSITCGSLSFQQEEFASIQKGDFILLDHKEPFHLAMETLPFFSVTIGQNQIHLVDYAFYYEDTMEPPKSDESELTGLKDIPLSVTIEMARFKIPLDKLMQLTPGNTLELPVHPEQNVFLSINGQKVGRAELIQIGEQLGVRILEIGSS